MISAAPCEMFWMGGNTLLGAYSGVGPENRALLGPTPEYAPRNVFPPIQNISHGTAEIIEA